MDQPLSRSHRAFVADAVRHLRHDADTSTPTPMTRHALPGYPGIDVLIKDESAHPTGSLKHRLARSLLLQGLVNGRIGPDTLIIEASSGSTAVSEAHFCRELGLPFVAVMARSTSPAKVRLVEEAGARCELVDDPTGVYEVAARLERESNGCYLDQFTNAERATDWRANHNLAEELLSQARDATGSCPDWIVVGAGTGGTSATLGRHIRYCGSEARLAVVDPEGSAFYPHWARLRGREWDAEEEIRPSKIEGIGRARVEPSFVPEVVDEMYRIPDAESFEWAAEAARTFGVHAGPSTGTNMAGVIRLAEAMRREGRTGTIATLACDSASRYV
ncbi:PLP-dependent cysteine synthase family protein [Falsarthrobacter nasiphocae]|uniref:Cysteine synthase A n=1 Tax=Falsarthrobacter nasiphocae TaxID=189863 RepID=A0AAE4C7P9_9MICC|nr:PLP-dependent cysteine synthase family protein [Falsarthrobacter nasiphocae]MDR6892749.1 cysteine synthase A [Falsarthrobacter nasiphocae]